MNVNGNEIKDLLLKYKKFSVYGLSPDVKKPSHYVPLYMQDQGWDIVGTYPKPHAEETFKIFNSLKDVPTAYRKFLDVFRAPDKIPELVEEVIALGGIEVLWLQLGIYHPEAEAKAEKAGIKVVSNRCLIIEHQRLF
jgi:predicted CoA-binding protein